MGRGSRAGNPGQPIWMAGARGTAARRRAPYLVTAEVERKMPERRGSTVIENVAPRLDCGRFPVKRAIGQPVRITADIFKEGHDDLAAVVRWRRITPKEPEPREERMRHLGNDAWEAELRLPGNGLYAFTVEAWPETFRTWVNE